MKMKRWFFLDAIYVFQVFDKHNRGYITASDLRAVLQCLGEDLSEEESECLYKVVICVLNFYTAHIFSSFSYIFLRRTEGGGRE